MNVKKGLVVAVILLFFSVSVIPLSGTTDVKQITVSTTSGDTLYVGGSGPNNYTKIQDAIDNASDGDTVFVYDDSSPYHGDVIVNKSIILEGENKNTTIIDGLKTYIHGIRILSNNTTVLNFKIQNNHYGGITIEHSKFCKVYNNIIDTNRYGIFVWNSSNNSIYNNTVANHGVGGIELYESHNNLVYRNVITDNGNETHKGDGVDLGDANSNIIIQNWITNNTGDGIFCIGSNNNSIRENNISWNQCNGIWGLSNSKYSQILYNVIKGNNRNGIEFSFGSSSYGNISGNLIIENNRSGIVLDESYFNIYANHIENNSFSGLVVYYGDDNNIFWNTISNNDDFGIHLVYTDNNTIRYNLIKQNKKTGLKLQYSSHNQIVNNNFISNRLEAHFILSHHNRWSGNYWNRLRILPKLIFGRMGDFWNIPWINVDWHPAQEPYDIGV